MGISLTVFINPNVSLSLDETILVTRGVPKESVTVETLKYFFLPLKIGIPGIPIYDAYFSLSKREK